MAVKPLVSTAGCLNISDLAKAIKQELSPKLNSYSSAQLTLHKTSDDTALEPDLPLASISTAGLSAKLPLIVKTLEPAPKCCPLDSFSKYLVESNDDLKQILEGKGSALYQLFNPKDKIIKFKQLINGEKYNVYSRYERSFADEVRWQQNEDQAMEEETHLAVRRFLATHLGPSAVDMPTDIMAADGKTIVQEWNAVFKDGNVLYLCEAKHNMTDKQVNKLPARIRKFKEFQANAQPEFRNVTKYAGVLCGTLFPEDIRKNAHLGFICVYPSGYRYDVKKPEDFIIER
ncbi:hypothetical protein BATDEDRAFT_92756 [Batrachochytrium dendrobatidis JAM81]|uniref:Uncharacterized protein n=1 Tax=Batrachochytrium dendrobatidis (strain JAM81 / FGSC 10211) TaxID=684364 RepID=F4PEC0_BATDJ|nr:uncharacterized protein BATDEDRAFT_92756 [Batrachochytrium dendrobatidis JAM81]EGF76398.1 hypothetical protein BATDEDRAFT_92756 [Batrachochytrium dendrobatidis JAM81]|eukprot:XP_006683011.1 hypothetical protein BATDEDRAFT_92756 [Batrachochytrium dendrobatidis JAM81]